MTVVDDKNGTACAACCGTGMDGTILDDDAWSGYCLVCKGTGVIAVDAATGKDGDVEGCCAQER